jgi:putative glycosyltransferase (TIGR04372 family)
MTLRNSVVRFSIFWLVARRHFRNKGFLWAVNGLVKRLVMETLWLCLLPVALFGHAIGYRCLNVQIEHIGHLAVEPDTLIKELRLGRIRKKRWILLAPINRVANVHLLSYWRLWFITVTSPAACWFLSVMSKHWLLRQDISHYVGKFFGPQDVYSINAQWGDRPATLSLTTSDNDWADRKLLDLGVPVGGWFVAVHVREGGFLPHNELIQHHRNAQIKNTFLAMQEIVNRGGICIRMGDPSMTPLPQMVGVIDYAFHSLKSARMDVILCARARFFLGCTSGLAFLATTFGVPIAHANMVPVETLGIRHCDLSIPKLLWDIRSERYLSFPEVFELGHSGYFFSQQYSDSGLRVDENSAEDIRNLVLEMLDRLDGKFVETAEDRNLHTAYMNLFRPGHYSSGATSRVCVEFLRKHLISNARLGIGACGSVNGTDS